MHLQDEAAAPMALGSGGEVDVNNKAVPFYLTSEFTATYLAATLFAAPFGLTEAVARLICDLSGLGGGLAR